MKVQVENDNLILCYVCEPWAYFTSAPLDMQWGDDWDDAPLEHNAEPPLDYYYHPIFKDRHECTIVKVAIDGFCVPYLTKMSTVGDVNRQRKIWLRSDCGQINIYAGTPLGVVRDVVTKAGGGFYEKK